MRSSARTVVRLLPEGSSLKGSKVSRLDFGGKSGQLAVCSADKRRDVLVGIGKEPQLANLQEGIHKAMTYLQETKTPNAHIVLPKSVRDSVRSTTNFFGPKSYPCDARQLQQLAVQWSYSSLYRFDRYKGAKKRPLSPKNRGPALTFGFGDTQHLDPSIVAKGKTVADAVCAARDLGNLRPDVCSPVFFTREIKQLAQTTSRMKKKLVVRHVIDEKGMKRLGMNLHLAVGRAAVRPPRLVVTEYVGNPAAPYSTAIVGKGVTMDTGGLNVKPFGSMETMHMDMMGAAAVFGATQAVARLQLPVNVVSVFALAENAVGSDAYMPSSIIKSLKGSTVEVLNTDAEGRLVLADALTYVQDHAKLRTSVDHVIDVATLTGACVVALGDKRAGMFSNNYGMVDTMVQAGEETLEPVWPLPIGADHVESMKGTHSDLINCTTGRYAGASTAAAFLHHFVNDGVQWGHVDIAGPGIGTKATKTHPSGAPGFGVSLLVKYFDKLTRR